jgi:RNA polymerase sigma factor (sigma-70 family)
MGCRRATAADWQLYGGVVDGLSWEVHGRFAGRVDHDDLRQVGMVALLETLQRFDEGRSASFGRFARIRIRGAMLDHARREVRRSPRLRVSRLDASATRSSLDAVAARRGGELDAADLAAITILPDGRRSVETAWRGGRRSMESEVLFRDFVRSLRSRLDGLGRPERETIEGHDLEGDSFARVAGRLGMSRSATVRARRRGLQQLRASW